MTLAAGAGNLHLRDVEHILPPTGTDPVRYVRRVEIRDSDGTVVLEGARDSCERAVAPGLGR